MASQFRYDSKNQEIWPILVTELLDRIEKLQPAKEADIYSKTVFKDRFGKDKLGKVTKIPKKNLSQAAAHQIEKLYCRSLLYRINFDDTRITRIEETAGKRGRDNIDTMGL